MTQRIGRGVAGAVLSAALLLGGCATPGGRSQDELSLDRALRGEPQVSGSELDRRLERAAAHPLGARENPVRAEGPPGQRAYLQRLRCSNGRAPSFSRIGNFGFGVFGNIIDGYRVSCGEAQPGEVQIFMDMYHPGHVEERAVPGFTIVPARPTI